MTTDTAPELSQQTRRREALVAAVLAALVVLAHRLASGQLTRAGWELAVKQQLLHAHLTAAALARGSFAAIDHDTALLVGTRLGEQFGYLDAFAATVPTGADFTAGQLARLAQYGNAAVRGTFSAVLRQDAAVAGDVEERNILSDSADSCSECPDLEKQGWVPIGTLPEIGERACYGNCACEIETRTAAEAAADTEKIVSGWGSRKYSEDQPRDEHGRWSGGGGASSGVTASTHTALETLTGHQTAALDAISTGKERGTVAAELAMATGGDATAIREQLQQWATGVGPRSMAFGIAAARELGADPKAEQMMQQQNNTAAGLYRAREVMEQFAKHEAQDRSLARAMYEKTQAALKSADITEVTLYRGMALSPAAQPRNYQPDAKQQDMVFMQRPLSSWSTSPGGASDFARGAYVHESQGERAVILRATFPAARIFSLPGTGLGTTHGMAGGAEREVVTLGGPGKVRVFNANDPTAHFAKMRLRRKLTGALVSTDTLYIDDPWNANWLRLLGVDMLHEQRAAVLRRLVGAG